MKLMRRAWLPVACALLQLVAVATGSTPNPDSEVSAMFTLLGVTSGAVLAWRARFLAPVLGYCALAYPAQAMLMAPPVPAAMTVLAFELARRPSADQVVAPASGMDGALAAPGWRRGAALGGAVVVGGVGLIVSGQPYWVAPYALVLVVAYSAGLTVSARSSREESRRRILLDEQRMQIARELHDVVGHNASAITAQSGAARMALAGGAVDDATAALREIEAASRALLREARWMVGLLRDVGDLPGLTELDGLVDNARRSGLDLRVAQSGTLERLPADASHAAYRIVQEALTNALRHGGEGPVQISLSVGDDLFIRVLNPRAVEAVPTPLGCAATDAVLGNGIRGMRERAEGVGGTVRVGPCSPEDWSVEAELPVGIGR